MEISVGVFNTVVSCADTELLMRLIEDAGNTKEVETKIKTYFKLMKTRGVDMNRIYINDLFVMWNICYALGSYYTIMKNKVSEVMMNVMEDVESTKSEGQYLRTCDMFMCHRKLLSFLEEVVDEEGIEEILIDEEEQTYEFVV